MITRKASLIRFLTKRATNKYLKNYTLSYTKKMSWKNKLEKKP